MSTPAPNTPAQHNAPASPASRAQTQQPWWAAPARAGHVPPSRVHWKLPLMGALLASAMLPSGLWSPSEPSAHAEGAASAATSESAAPTTSSASTAASTSTPAVSSTNPSTPSVAAPAAAPAVEFKPAAPKIELLNWSVRAIVGGRETTSRVEVPRGANVSTMLARLGVALSPLDRVFPPAASAAYDGISIRVRRVEAPLKTRSQSIPFETRYLPTNSMSPGSQDVIQDGRSGRLEITERTWSIDGKVTLREKVSQRVVLQPQPKVIGLGSRTAYVPGRTPYHSRYARAYGLAARGGGARDRYMAAPRLAAGIAGKSLRATRMIELVATGYSPDPRENGGYTTTATGLPIGYGAAAVDPRVIPLGTKMYVEGYGYAFACDTGGAIKGRRIDLAYNSYYEANTKGHKKVRVWILAP